MALPSRTFNGAQGTTSKDTRSPEQLIIDLDNLFALFDPNGTLHDGSPGGIPATSSQLLTPDSSITPVGFAGNGNYLVLLSHIARLLLAITGAVNWYTVPVASLYELANATYYVHPNHTGDVTSLGDGATTIANNAVTTNKILNSAVTLAKMANMATASLLYRKSSGTGAPEVQTLSTLKTDLGLMQASDIQDQKTGGQFKISICTQTEYDAITPDASTIYFIKGA